jgi:hypothetical protein
VIWFARGFSLHESEECQYRARRDLDQRVRAAAWKLLPQLPHRQHLPGGHCGLLTWHTEVCASRKGCECDCEVHVELDLPGRN